MKIADIIKGDFLLNERFRRNAPFVAYIAFLALLSIYSGHKVDSKVLQISKMRNQVKELNSEYIDTRSQLMIASTHTRVVQKAKDLGLEESKTPPKKIKLNKKGKPVQD